jgi:hypothetical protein
LCKPHSKNIGTRPRIAEALARDKTPRLDQHLPPTPNPATPLTPAARRALEEAEARRVAAAEEAARAAELGGPKGLEPTRFGDWERKGIAVDF